MSVKKGGNQAQAVFELVKPIVDELGLTLWDVRFEKEGASWFLKVYIDKDGGVDIDDCEAVTRPVNEMLDRVDPISQSYTLEVGSPGLGREFRRQEHFERYLGEQVRVRLIRAVDGAKEIIGKLDGYTKTAITIKWAEGDKAQEIDLAECAFVKLYDDGDLF